MPTEPNSTASASDTPWTSSFSRHPLAFLVLVAIGGLLAASGVVWLLVAVANLFADKTAVARIDDSVANWLTYNGSVAGDAAFSAISLLGGWALLAVVIAVIATLAARRDWQRASAVTVACGGAVVLNKLLKAAFERAHSLNATEFTSAAQSWNFPSGHAINALVAYGILAYLLAEASHSRGARFSIVMGASALVVIIGFTRIYLGIHSLSDVVTGYMAGVVWLCVCIAAYRWAGTNARETGDVAEPGDFATAS